MYDLSLPQHLVHPTCTCHSRLVCVCACNYQEALTRQRLAKYTHNMNVYLVFVTDVDAAQATLRVLLNYFF